MPGLKIVSGLASFGSAEDIKEALKILQEVGIKNIDTAQLYGDGLNEKLLGEAGAGDCHFFIDTKSYGGWQPGVALRRDELIRAAHESFDNLKLKPTPVDIFYIHGPDDSIPLEEWIPGIDELYREGSFQRFGLSNFSAQQVRDVYNFCSANGYIKPTVYQGNYNPVARKAEFELLPTLRELGLCFYAYSPLAGGFLTKSKKALVEGSGTGRFKVGALGGMFTDMYVKPSYLDALERWETIAETEGISKAELAYRWVSYHSALQSELGDALIIGASKTSQIRDSAQGLAKGPLSTTAAEAVDGMWKALENEAPLDNYAWFKSNGQKL